MGSCSSVRPRTPNRRPMMYVWKAKIWTACCISVKTKPGFNVRKGETRGEPPVTREVNQLNCQKSLNQISSKCIQTQHYPALVGNIKYSRSIEVLQNLLLSTASRECNFASPRRNRSILRVHWHGSTSKRCTWTPGFYVFWHDSFLHVRFLVFFHKGWLLSQKCWF